MPTLLNDMYLLYSCWCDMVLLKIRLRRWVQDSVHCIQILFCKGSLMSTATTVPSFMGAKKMWAVKGKITFPSKSSVSLMEKIVSANPMISQRQKKQGIRSFRNRNRWKQTFYQDKIMTLQIITIIQFKQVPLYRLDFSVCKPLVTLKQIICKAIITLPVSQTLWRI